MQSPVKLIIFNKDGTLIDFCKLWLSDWTLIGENMAGQFRPFLAKIASSGALSQENLILLHSDLSQVLHHRLGLPEAEADKIIDYFISESGKRKAHLVCDLRKMLLDLRAMGVRSALCTADAREFSVRQMKELDILDLFDDVVAGDDDGMVQKPDPYGARLICNRLGVKLNETIVVGDTVADVKMGKQAGLRASVAVLGGVGTKETLAEYTDHFLKDVSELPALIAHLNKDALPEVQKVLPTIVQRRRDAVERKQIYLGQLVENYENEQIDLFQLEKDCQAKKERLSAEHFEIYEMELLRIRDMTQSNWRFLKELRRMIEEEMDMEDIMRDMEDMELEQLHGEERMWRQRELEEVRNQRLITMNNNRIERQRRQNEAVLEGIMEYRM